MISTNIPSQSEAGKEYKVVLAENGWHCTCPAFVFSKKLPRTCKHISEAYKKLEEKIKN